MHIWQKAKFLTMILLLWPFVAFGSANDSLNQQDWIIRNQQNILEEEKRQKEFKTLKKVRDNKKKSQELESQDLKVSSKVTQCFVVKEIHLNGASLLSQNQQKKITEQFIGQCFVAEILSNLVNLINSHYHNLGYITVQVVVPKQNIVEGVLHLNVVEGRVEELVLGTGKISDKMQKFSAFGLVDGEMLNINHINQGLYQMNRLSSNLAVMKILPGSEDGQSRVEIENNKRLPLSLNLSHDNLGNDFTGIRRSSISAGFDNLLFLNDNINLSYTTNLNNNNSYKDLKSFSAGISIPFGYSTFSFDYYKSEYLGTIIGDVSVTKSTGFSDQKKFGFNYLLFSSANNRLAFDTSLAIKETASYQNGVKNADSQRRLVVNDYSMVLSSYFDNSTSLYLKPTYSRGLKILDAKKDLKDLTANEAKAQFEVVKLYASVSKRFNYKIPFAFVSEFNGQIAKSALFGSEQFSVGGYYSVRGFRENYITGDSGYNFRNKLNVNLGSLSGFSYLNKFSFEPFYDYGFVKTKDGIKDSGRLSGAGFKTIFNGKYFNASITYGSALQKSRLITSPVKENKMVYFELSAGI